MKVKIFTIIMILITICCCGKKSDIPSLPTDTFNYSSEIIAKANELIELSPFFDLDKEQPIITTTEFNVTNKFVFPFIYSELYNISAEDLKVFGAESLMSHITEVARGRALGEALYREATKAGFTTSDASVDERVDLLAKGEMSELLTELDSTPFTIDYIKQDYRHIIVIEKYKEYTIGKVKTEVSDEEAKKYYDKNRDLVTTKKHAIVRHIFKDTANMNEEQISKALQEMKQLRMKIDTTADFLDCVAKYSDDEDTKKEGGLVADYITPGQTEEAIDNVIFSMPAGGGISDVVQSSFGLHIFMVDKILPEELMPFDEISSKLKDIIVIDRQNKAIDDEINRVTKKYRIKEVKL